jgi:integrase
MLKVFFVWVMEKAKNKHFTEVNKRDYIKFQGYCLNDLGHSPARIRTIRSSISSLGIYVENILDDVYEDFRSVILKIEAPKLAKVREKTIVTFEECEAVCEKLYQEGRYQLSAFLAVAVYSGMRKQELTRLLYKDFTENKNIVYKAFYKTSPIKLKGDIHKKDNKLVWNKCDKYLNAWIEQRERDGIDCDYLFIRKENEKYYQMKVATANSFAQSLDKYFDSKLYMHSLRHCLCTNLLKMGVPIEVVQVLLSHSSSAVTAIYDDREKDESLGAFEDFFSGKDTNIEKKGLGDL